MSWFYLFISLIFTIEILIRLKILEKCKKLKLNYLNLIPIFFDKNKSDNEKQKLLLYHSFKIFKNSFIILIIFFISILPFALIDLFINRFNYDLFTLIISANGTILSIIFSIGYIYLRNKIAN